MVLTKASAMPFDCGLSIGVVHGTRPIARASARVSPAVYGEPLSDSHSIGLGSLSTSPKRRSTLSTIRSRISELLMPPVVAVSGMAFEQQPVRFHDPVNPLHVHRRIALLAALAPQ